MARTPLVAFFNIPICEMVARRTDAVSDKLTISKRWCFEKVGMVLLKLVLEFLIEFGLI